MDDVDLRLDGDYQASLMTTFGPVRFPLFAYTAKRKLWASHGRKVRVPCKETFLALYLRCRSSELCVEWETRLGSDHPFRLAQDELNFFTHGAVTTEDNTIARHLVHASASLERQWLYRKPKEIRKILAERAMYDLQSRLPVIYMSSDAHALRRYVDETWDSRWKMTNGLRLWCVDRDTGEHIHLGGEFTWGDCKHVTNIFKELIRAGILPADGDFKEGVKAQYVWLSDGAPWFEERLVVSDSIPSSVPRKPFAVRVRRRLEVGHDRCTRTGGTTAAQEVIREVCSRSSGSAGSQWPELAKVLQAAWAPLRPDDLPSSEGRWTGAGGCSRRVVVSACGD
jgi:hypothetical protein